MPLVCDLASLADVRALPPPCTPFPARPEGSTASSTSWAAGAAPKASRTRATRTGSSWNAAPSPPLRNVTRVFYDDLAASRRRPLRHGLPPPQSPPRRRPAPATLRPRPPPKPGPWRWPRASAGSSRAPARKEQHSAAVIFVVKGLVDAGMRAKSPGRSFPGFTDVTDLAAAAVGLFTAPAAELNGQRLLLSR